MAQALHLRARFFGRNPRTGEEVAITSGKTIRFKPGKELQGHDGADNDLGTDDEDFGDDEI